MGVGLAVGLGAGALAGGVSGAMGSKKKSKTSGERELVLDEAGARELLGFDLQEDQLKALQGILTGGPGRADFEAATGAQRSFADMLGEYAQSGGMPTQADIGAGRGFAEDIYAPQRTEFRQHMEDATTMQNRQSAMMGRAQNDPILAAKLAQTKARGYERIGSQETAVAAQFAQGLPGRRLGYAGQRADVLGGLGNMAVQSRLQLLGLGQQLGGQERQFRLATALQKTKGEQTSSSGGGFGGMLTGALGGAGAGANIASAFQGFGRTAPSGGGGFNQFAGQLSQPTQFGSSGFQQTGQFQLPGRQGQRYNLG